MSKKSASGIIASQAKNARRARRRANNLVADQVCKRLGINPRTTHGYDVHRKAVEMADSFTPEEIYLNLSKSESAQIARREVFNPLPRKIKVNKVKTDAVRLRMENEARWNAARKGISDKPSRSLTFGINPSVSRTKPVAPKTPAPKKQNTPPDLTLNTSASVTKTKKVIVPMHPQTVKQPSSNPSAVIPSGFLPAGSTKKLPFVGKKLDMVEVTRKMIPAGLIADFRKYIFEHRTDESTPEQLATDFMALHSPAPIVKPTETVELSPVPEVVTPVVAEVAPVVVPAPAAPRETLSIKRYVDATDYSEIANNESVTVIRQRNAAAQKAFRDAVMANCHGRCLVSGKTYDHALQACHIQAHAKGGRMHVTNGLILEASLHDVFDNGDMAIHPVTLCVYFSPAAIEGGFGEYQGKAISATVYPLDAEGLVERWEAFTRRHGHNNFAA